jgi:hypothetical protein
VEDKASAQSKMVMILDSSLALEAGPVLVAILGFSFTLLLVLILLLHSLAHPMCMPPGAKQEIRTTLTVLGAFVHSEPDGVVGNERLSPLLRSWVIGGFTDYKTDVDGEPKLGININNYSNTSIDEMTKIGAAELSSNDRMMCNLKKLIDQVKIVECSEETTQMMRVLNHQKRTSEAMSLIKQILIGFDWSVHTGDLLKKRTLGPIIDSVTRVHGSPTFPRALSFSEVRDLRRSSNWRERLLNVCVLCEQPWNDLKQDDWSIIKSAVTDLLAFSVKALILPVALGLSVSSSG